MKLKNMFARFKREESGATAIEYGLIAALISIVIITAVIWIGPYVADQLDQTTIEGLLDGAGDDDS